MQCEGGDYWDDGDGKGGFDPCDRTDTQFYESGFLLTGTAGWFCPAHWPLEEDMRLTRERIERAKQQKV